MVVVLSNAYRHTADTTLVNVAPVTDDERLAADWSIVFDALDSGIGTPAVIHVDHEQSATTDSLRYCLGRLPQRAGTDLLSIAHAWHSGNQSQIELSVGRLGEVEMRTQPQWQILDALLAKEMEVLCAPARRSSDAAAFPTTGTTGLALEKQQRRPTVPATQRIPAAPGLWLGARRVAEPAAEWLAANIEATTVGAVILSFLADAWNSRLEEWSEAKGAELTWQQIHPIEDVKFSHLRGPPGEWRKKVVEFVGPNQSHLSQLLLLLNEVRYFVDQKSGHVTGQSVRQQAARSQPDDPDSSRKGTKGNR
jgi:hypothetical protein